MKTKVKAAWATVLFLYIAGALAQSPMALPSQVSVTPGGSLSYDIPVSVPPGVAGVEPKLSLSYNSQSGNGLMGMGWRLGGLSMITRCPQTITKDGMRGAVNYDNNDRYCLDGQRLTLVSGIYGAADSEYRTEIDTPESVSLDCPAAQFWFDDLFGGKSRTDFPPDMRNGGLEAGHFGSIGAVVV